MFLSFDVVGAPTIFAPPFSTSSTLSLSPFCEYKDTCFFYKDKRKMKEISFLRRFSAFLSGLRFFVPDSVPKGVA